MRRSLVLFAFTSGALLSVALPVDAHLQMRSQQSRYGSQQKAGPCGMAGGPRTTDRVYIAKPGVQVMLTWEETVNHPSFFRIDFDTDGTDDLTIPILDCPAPKNDIGACFDTANSGPYMVNNIADDAASTQSYLYTLPSVECDNCTLQVIQAMHDKPPFEVTPTNNDIYYQCVDIILAADGPDELTLLGAPDGGPDDGDGGGNVDSGCGCQSSGGGEGLMGLGLLALVAVRRRRR